MSTRREFITVLGSAAVWPLAARAQQPTNPVRRIGFLSGFPDNAETRKQSTAFQEGLKSLGWAEGGNVKIEFHYTAGDAARINLVAAEMVRSAPDVILAAATPVLAALHKQTSTTPIVFVNVSDPLDGGFVASMARPGGNITGFTSFEYSLGGKWVELLKETVPSLSRVLVLLNEENYTSRSLLRTIEGVAPSAGVLVTGAAVRNAFDIETAIDGFGAKPHGAVIVLPDPATTVNADRLMIAADRHQLPTLQAFRWFAVKGGLISYGTNNDDLYRRAASYVDRILKGAKPSELPVQNPTKYDLVINLKTAKALGLEVPPTLLGRADEVIE